MTPQDLIIQAIKSRKPIEFEYNRPDKVRGKRIGNPHIIFAGTTRDGIDKVWTHIAQTGGVSDTLKDFPDWRMFVVEFIENIRVLKDEPSFALQEGYNPTAEMYSQTIAKV